MVMQITTPGMTACPVAYMPGNENRDDWTLDILNNSKDFSERLEQQQRAPWRV
jgi:hypothetical protein